MYPLVICSHGRIVIAPDGWFNGIGFLDLSQRSLRINVGTNGVSGLLWFLDASGDFYELAWRGLEPVKFLQTIRLSKRVEAYSLSDPRRIRVAELSNLVGNLSETFDEAPNAADLLALLQKKLPDEIVSRELMLEYLQESEDLPRN